jgi:hypothetical protein
MFPGKTAMPRYHFHIRWTDRKNDDETGMLLADDAAARDYAERLIREIKGGDGHETSLTMIVERSGIVIFTIPFQDV